ncbi:glycosyltransferase family 8 protein [Caballeronia grimmiae]|uniref:glycosyltransferase family 8 protein n=1 Tax=Caballeronia grimmiae TaxID=1071679 RepID=UPI0038BB33D7
MSPPPTTVVYCFDKGYAPYGAVSTFSLISNAKSALEIFWIVPHEDQASIVPLLSAVEEKTGQSVTLITVLPDLFDTWKVINHISRGTYLRLLIPSLINESRVIYLDADTLILSDLSPLFSMDMGNHLIAGVKDPGDTIAQFPRHAGDPYLNAGVLLMNLDALRADVFLEKAQALYQKHETEIVYLDQCLINKYAEGRKLVVDSGWNRLVFSHSYTASSFEQLVQDSETAILHFVSQFKPWQRWCTPVVFDFWWQYGNRLGVENLKPETLTTSTADHALTIARYFDEKERFSEASIIKSKMIDDLIALLKGNAATA